MILDDEDERLWFKATGSFEAEVLPEREEDDAAEGQWSALKSPEDMVQFYDPTDLFGDLAESLADTYPGIAPATTEDDDDEDDADGRRRRGRRGRRRAADEATTTTRTTRDADDEPTPTAQPTDGKPSPA